MKSMTPETVFSCVVYLFGGFCFVFQQPRGGFVVFLDPFGGVAVLLLMFFSMVLVHLKGFRKNFSWICLISCFGGELYNIHVNGFRNHRFIRGFGACQAIKFIIQVNPSSLDLAPEP